MRTMVRHTQDRQTRDTPVTDGWVDDDTTVVQ